MVKLLEYRDKIFAHLDFLQLTFCLCVCVSSELENKAIEVGLEELSSDLAVNVLRQVWTVQCLELLFQVNQDFSWLYDMHQLFRIAFTVGLVAGLCRIVESWRGGLQVALLCYVWALFDRSCLSVVQDSETMVEGLVAKGEQILMLSLMCHVPAFRNTPPFEVMRKQLHPGTPASLANTAVRFSGCVGLQMEMRYILRDWSGSSDPSSGTNCCLTCVRSLAPTCSAELYDFH